MWFKKRKKEIKIFYEIFINLNRSWLSIEFDRLEDAENERKIILKKINNGLKNPEMITYGTWNINPFNVNLLYIKKTERYLE